jgi:hypothetical protein
MAIAAVPTLFSFVECLTVGGCAGLDAGVRFSDTGVDPLRGSV